MKATITIDEAELRQLVEQRIQQAIPGVPVHIKQIKIETKSSQNYRSEWESGARFRATYEYDSETYKPLQ